MKKILEFLSENFQFLVVKFSVYLNRHVFVMDASNEGCNSGPCSKLMMSLINVSLKLWHIR